MVIKVNKEEQIYIFMASLAATSGGSAFISFAQEHMDINVNNAPYFYRAIITPLASHIAVRFGIYGIYIPSIADGNFEERLTLAKESDIVSVMTQLIMESVDEIAKNLEYIWDMPDNYERVKKEVEDISSRIFKEKRILNIQGNAFTTMHMLSMALHYEGIAISLMAHKGDILLQMEKKLGYFPYYRRLCAETMLAYMVSPIFGKKNPVIPNKVKNRVIPMIEDILTTEECEKTYREKSPMLTYPYNITKDILGI